MVRQHKLIITRSYIQNEVMNSLDLFVQATQLQEEFCSLSKNAGQLFKSLTKSRNEYRALVFNKANGSTTCRNRIRRTMKQLIPIVSRMAVVFVETSESWTNSEDLVTIMRSFYGISDDALLTFDLK